MPRNFLVPILEPVRYVMDQDHYSSGEHSRRDNALLSAPWKANGGGAMHYRCPTKVNR
jgi:hypothetical protein